MKKIPGYRFFLQSLPFFTLLIITGVFFNSQAGAQEKRNFKNTIKYNLTSGILYDNAFRFGYERILNKNQSIDLELGYNEFPLTADINFPGIFFKETKKKSGYSIALDYRFYLRNENKFGAPRGVYLAPFVSLHHFNRDRTLGYVDSSGQDYSTQVHTGINFFNVGGELGYQFVLWNRVVIDAIMFGPALTYYDFNGKLKSQLPGIKNQELVSELIDALEDKLPMVKELGKDHELNDSGIKAFWSVGFRYSISIGFRF